jgi:hypothetical protein
MKVIARAAGSVRTSILQARKIAAPHTEGDATPPPRSDLFYTRRLEFPPRPIDQKVFQDKPPLSAVQRPAAVMAFCPAM